MSRATQALTATVALLAVAGLAAGTSCRRAASPREPVERQTGFARADDGTRIYYEAAGTGPPLVLIHGLAGNHAVWFQQTAALSGRFRVITLSQRGFAPSDANPEGYEVEALAGDLATVMDALGVTSAHIAGQSMGGWTALGFALAHPQRTRSLVLADTVAGIFDEEISAAYAATLERARRLASRPPAVSDHPALGNGFKRSHPELSYLYQALSSFGSPRPADIASALGRSAFPLDALARLEVPVLFIVGSEDSIFPPAVVERAASYLSGARVERIGGAGHSPYFERPRAWNRIVARFLDTTDE